jgi:uncharacterized membrane protein YphA (DoxX/SURF4 family)
MSTGTAASGTIKNAAAGNAEMSRAILGAEGAGRMTKGRTQGFEPLMNWAMRRQVVVGDKLIRLAIAMVWLYQGLWCKVLGGAPRHEAVIASAPFIGPVEARAAMVAIGLVECGLAVWVLLGWQRRWAALAQTALLVGMNAAGLIWARSLLADPAGMIFENFAFVLLIWVAAEDRERDRGRDRRHVDHA